MGPEEKAEWSRNYVRILRGEKKDPEKIRKGLQQGLGVKHPEKIMGYAGFFFDPGDVYASGHVAGRMEDERFEEFVMESLERFDKGDFGEISWNDESENIENRYLYRN